VTAFEDFWRVNDCCGIDREDAETIWRAGFWAGAKSVRPAPTVSSTLQLNEAGQQQQDSG
jgi:hypothetical protein